MGMYSEEDAIRSIQKVAKEYGDIDSKIYYRSGAKPSLSWILKRIGTWNKVVRQAGFIPKRNRADIELLEQFKTNIEELGYIPSSHEYLHLSLNPSLAIFAERGFTWDDLLAEANIAKPLPVKEMKTTTVTCEVCGKETVVKFLTVNFQKYCSEECEIADKKRTYRENRERRLSQGLCVRCEEKAEHGKKHCSYHLNMLREIQMKRRQKHDD